MCRPYRERSGKAPASRAIRAVLPWIGVKGVFGLLAAACLAAPLCAGAEEDYSFDAGEYEPRVFELRGYLEIEPAYSKSNEHGALFQLEFFDEAPRDTISRLPAVLELEGRYRNGAATVSFRTHSSKVWDYTHESAEHKLYEGLFTLQPDPGFTFDLGKKAYLWGTGYAWNPVAFVERAKDAGNADLAREGFWTVGFDWIRSFDGPLKTVAFTPLLLPNDGNVNEEFGQDGHTNIAARLYLLYGNTDIHFMALGEGSKSARYGMDFASNLSPNFEIHGEAAYLTDVSLLDVTPECQLRQETPANVFSYLAGLRYRTQADIGIIAEYYYNGAGNRMASQQRFYDCVHRAWEAADPDLLAGLPLTGGLDQGPFTKPNPMRRYVNLRAWWDEPHNLLYFVPAIQVLYNLDDDSYSISPEFNYDGIDELSMRLRLTVPIGDRLTEWGEKANDYMVEFRLRYYF
jgi:hypothetical protein